MQILYIQILQGHEFLNFICKLKNLSSNDQAIRLARELNLDNDLEKK